MNLTIQQGQALAHDGDLLIVGGPGCGKTTVGLLKARNRIERGLEPGQAILFLSFSRSAIAQIQSAARVTLPQGDRGSLRIHTFHSFCWDILRCHGHLLGLPKTVDVLLPEDALPLKVECGVELWPSRERELAHTDGRVTFDLFTPLARELLSRCARLRRLLSSCYPLVIVDEFQDTDDDQYAVIEALSEGSVLVALGDQDQRIHDHRPGVSARRLFQFQERRRPRVITLVQNHRSPARTHLAYARHVLQPDLGGAGANSIRIGQYQQHNQAGVKLKHEVRRIENLVREQRPGAGPVSVAVLGTTNETVRQLSRWLSHPTPAANFSLAHDVFTDATETASAWQFAVALLGCAEVEEPQARVACLLGRLADYVCCCRQRADDTVIRLRGWSADLCAGNRPKRAAAVDHLGAAVHAVRTAAWSGNPTHDISRLREIVAGIETKYIADVALVLAQCCPIRAGTEAHNALSDLFRETGGYAGAEAAFRRSQVQDRLTEPQRESRGRSVMTLHRSKGKEFDAVVIFDGLHSPHRLTLRSDEHPFERSRRLLHVGMTRARVSVTLLTPTADPCPLLPAAR